MAIALGADLAQMFMGEGSGFAIANQSLQTLRALGRDKVSGIRAELAATDPGERLLGLVVFEKVARTSEAQHLRQHALLNINLRLALQDHGHLLRP